MLCSTTTRTTQTWHLIQQRLGIEARVDYTRRLYLCSAQSMIATVADLAGDARRVLVVGHNPTMASLATLLDDGEGDDEASNEITIGYPTSAMAVFTFDGDWSDLDEASATVVAYHVGRG